jgi:hypothetical protein
MKVSRGILLSSIGVLEGYEFQIGELKISRLSIKLK